MILLSLTTLFYHILDNGPLCHLLYALCELLVQVEYHLIYTVHVLYTVYVTVLHTVSMCNTHTLGLIVPVYPRIIKVG